MKSFITLAIVFAFIYNVQALNNYLELKIENPNIDSLKSHLTGQMIGKTAVHNFAFPTKYYMTHETFNYVFNFPEHLDLVKITYKTKSLTPIYLKSLIVSTPTFGRGLEHNVYLPEKTEIYNGETVAFKKA